MQMFRGIGLIGSFLTNHINMWRIYFLAVEIVTNGKERQRLTSRQEQDSMLKG